MLSCSFCDMIVKKGLVCVHLHILSLLQSILQTIFLLSDTAVKSIQIARASYVQQEPAQLS